MPQKLRRRAVMLSAEFATPRALGQHGSSCEILAVAAPPDHSRRAERRAEVCCRDDGDHRDLCSLERE